MITLEILRAALGWCTLINLGLLYTWFFWIMLAPDWTYRFHHQWFNLSREHFDSLHYGGMAIFKLGIILFNLTPYVALLIIS